MESVSGPSSFLTSGGAYDSFMGRYSVPLAALFAESARIEPGWSVLDVGCGPGALTQVLADRVGPADVAAIDPSPPFVAECASRCPGVDVRAGDAEAIPHADDSFDAVVSQLVLHFVGDPDLAGREFMRVVQPGGVAAACVWDFTQEMEMLRHFWDAALTVDPDAPDEARVLRFGRPGEISAWLTRAGFHDVVETELTVTSTYTDFDELWSGYLHGVGPAGAYCVGLDEERRARLRAELFRRLGDPSAAFTLGATARSAVGVAPS